MVQTMFISVLRVVFEFPPIIGGSVNHIIELCEKMDKCLERQIIIAPNFVDGRNFDEKWSIPVHRINYPPLSFSLPIFILPIYAMNVVKEINRVLNCTHIDIIHVHGPMLASFIKFLSKIKSLNKPIVCMCHGGYSRKDIGGRLSWMITHKLNKFFPSDHYILLDDGSDPGLFKNKLSKYGLPNTIVYHGINTLKFRPSKNDKQNLIIFPHLPHSGNIKRKDLALEILQKVVSVDKTIKMVFFDNGDETKEMVKSYNLEDNAIIHPIIEDRNNYHEIIANGKVVISTSTDIGNTNRGVQECMSCGLVPIIFEDKCESKLVVDGFNGYIVNKFDLNHFSACVLNLMNNDALVKTIGTHARETIICHRNWNSRINIEIDIYNKLLIRP